MSTGAATIPAAHWRQRVVNALMVTIVVAAVLDILRPGTMPPWGFVAPILAALILNARNLKPGGALTLLAVALVLAADVIWFRHDLSEVGRRAGLLYALFVSLKAMGQIASLKPEIRAVADVVTRQPPRRSYLALTLGTHLLGLVLNFGSVVLVASMLAPRLKVIEAPARQRSMIVAVFRGFAATPLWSPLSIAPVIILGGVASVSYYTYMPVGLALALGFLWLGYVLDGSRGAGQGVPAKALSAAELRALYLFLLNVVLLVGLPLALNGLLSMRMIDAVLLSVLTITMLWLLLLPGAEFIAWLRDINRGDLPGNAVENELAILVGAAVLGALVALQLSNTRAFGVGELGRSTVIVLSFCLPLLIFAPAMIAINPIVTGTFLAEVLSAVWPETAAIWLVAGLLAGWTIATSGTPFTANLLLGSRIVGQRTVRVALHWNAAQSLIALAAGGGICALGSAWATAG
ncbi:hypothetical protein [Antarctobacter sp.]|uniref:hypothetical protein n=1 Tax=Antarctobacter sp. TaxID=1872577 RepID=UPI003A95497A